MSEDLYLNIVGRAGRAGFHEGFVIVIESEASAHLLEQELWNEKVEVAVAGKCAHVVVLTLPLTIGTTVEMGWRT